MLKTPGAHMSSSLPDRILGCFIGGIVGDSFGAAYEFKDRDSYKVGSDMGTTVFGMPPGSFTDDSSMMLCLAASLIETGTFAPHDQMDRYARWRRDGYMSSDEKRGCFDIGKTTSKAISRFVYEREQWERNGEKAEYREYYGLTGEYDSGNGGIMRLSPVPIFYFGDIEEAGRFSELSSKVTHASQECLEAANVMGQIVVSLLQGRSKSESVLNLPASLAAGMPCKKIIYICNATYLDKSRAQIATSGYVIDTLEAALWAFMRTETFEDGMMLLAAMGGDVDTVCAVYGQIAGAHYGYEAIPKRWANALQRIDLIAKTAMGLTDAALRRNAAAYPLNSS